MSNINIGSVCSGIEAASVAWADLGFTFQWFSEIEEFPSRLLKDKYPSTPNLGDMCCIPLKISNREIATPDLVCGGTPCQAFSLAGWKRGLEDDRGNLTLKFVDIIEANDCIRLKDHKEPTIVLWENVEGVLKDKTNAFGCFLSSLAGFEKEIPLVRWPSSGMIHGPKRNIAWRVLDAKYFGLPQQRKRLYVLAGGKSFFPENVLFEVSKLKKEVINDNQLLCFNKEGNEIEVFRSYTDCLYSAYGTKWNGNAAAYNGSLFVAQNRRLRRFTPLECERLMGFPDNYTDLPGVKPTARYKAIGNSWAIPVIKWIGHRLISETHEKSIFADTSFSAIINNLTIPDASKALDLSNDRFYFEDGRFLNSSEKPFLIKFGSLFNIIDVNVDENYYITPAGCKGILRRKSERQLKINPRLEKVLLEISSLWSDDKIEEISRKQNRGKFSLSLSAQENSECMELSLFG